MKNVDRVRVLVLIVSIVPSLGALCLSPPAHAAFPGEDGKIAFTSTRGGPSYDVYVMKPDGSGVNRLTYGGLDSWSSWSPDGSKIAFASGRAGQWDIYVVNADGSGETRLTYDPVDNAQPAWSPNGSKIAFTGMGGIYVMNADGTNQVQLVLNAEQPAWSPDGSKIAFVTQRDGNYEVYVMNADGSGQMNLTNNAAGDNMPNWSPDGSKIVFASDRDLNSEIYAMNADGSGQTRLTNNVAYDGDPAWSPDGSEIVFTSHRDGNDEVYVMNADGTAPTRLTNNDAGDWDPDWQSLKPKLADLADFSTLPTNNMTLIVGDIALNPHGSKPAGVNYQQGRDTTPLGFVSGMLANPQPSIFDTNATWINATSGRPFASIPPDLIFSIGGPGINAVTYYYESTSNGTDLAPVKFGYNSTHFYWVLSNGTIVPGSEALQSSTDVPPGTSDVFVIQILRDGDGRLVVLMYGSRYTGTWAAAWWFKFVVYPNIQDYTSRYYVVRWTDAPSGLGSDYTPDLGDRYTILAQG